MAARPDRTPTEGHAAKRWVEEHFPTITGNGKARLILAYGAGLDAGLAEAQQVLQEVASEYRPNP